MVQETGTRKRKKKEKESIIMDNPSNELNPKNQKWVKDVKGAYISSWKGHPTLYKNAPILGKTLLIYIQLKVNIISI